MSAVNAKFLADVLVSMGRGDITKMLERVSSLTIRRVLDLDGKRALVVRVVLDDDGPVAP